MTHLLQPEVLSMVSSLHVAHKFKTCLFELFSVKHVKDIELEKEPKGNSDLNSLNLTHVPVECLVQCRSVQAASQAFQPTDPWL